MSDLTTPKPLYCATFDGLQPHVSGRGTGQQLPTTSTAQQYLMIDREVAIKLPYAFMTAKKRALERKKQDRKRVADRKKAELKRKREEEKRRLRKAHERLKRLREKPKNRR